MAKDLHIRTVLEKPSYSGIQTLIYYNDGQFIGCSTRLNNNIIFSPGITAFCTKHNLTQPIKKQTNGSNTLP